MSTIFYTKFIDLSLFNQFSSFLKVRDGPSQSSPLINKFWGRAIIDTIHSSGNNLWFRYYTSSTRRYGRNYDLFYLSTEAGRGCGGTLYNTRGVVTSPEYPRPHAQASNCEWILKVPPGQRIQLKFACKYDA